MNPNDITLESIDKLFEYEKHVRIIDNLSEDELKILTSYTYLPGFNNTVCEADNDIEIVPCSGLVIVDANETEDELVYVFFNVALVDALVNIKGSLVLVSSS